MAGSPVYIVVTESYGEPDGTDSPTGVVAFQLTGNIQQPEFVAAKTVRAPLAFAAFAQELVATDFDSAGDPLFPSTLQYRVTETILGAAEQDYFINVPAVPPGSRAVADAVSTIGTQTVTSATADFTDDDENAYVLLEGFPVGTQIQSVVSSSVVLLSTAAAASGTGGDLLIGASVALSALRPEIL